MQSQQLTRDLPPFDQIKWASICHSHSELLAPWRWLTGSLIENNAELQVKHWCHRTDKTKQLRSQVCEDDLFFFFPFLLTHKKRHQGPIVWLYVTHLKTQWLHRVTAEFPGDFITMPTLTRDKLWQHENRTTLLPYVVCMENRGNMHNVTPKHWITIAIWPCHWDVVIITKRHGQICSTKTSRVHWLMPAGMLSSSPPQ